MPRLVLLVLASTVLLAPGCKSQGEPPQPAARTAAPVDTAAPADTAGVVQAVGTIRYLDFEGGFFGIETAGGERYNPLDLDERFRRDGLQVRFRARLRTDVMTIQMWGRPVEILEMEER